MASSGRAAAFLSTSRRPLSKLTCHLALACGRPRWRGEQAEERADPVPVLGGMPEHAVVVDGVPGAPPGPEAAGAFFKAGFTDLALVQIGGTEPEQDRFLAAAPELITAVKETAG
jgi:hypothetical protein